MRACRLEFDPHSACKNSLRGGVCLEATTEEVEMAGFSELTDWPDLASPRLARDPVSKKQGGVTLPWPGCTHTWVCLTF